MDIKSTVSTRRVNFYKDTKANLDALAGLRDQDLGYGTDTGLLYRQNGTGAANWEAVTQVGDMSVLKTSVQTVNNSTALVNDTALLFPMEANKIYAFDIFISAFVHNTSDLKVAFTGSVTSSIFAFCRWYNSTNGDVRDKPIYNLATGYAITQDIGDATGYVHIKGVIVCGATAGNCQFQFAQNAAVAVDTNINNYSYVIYKALN